MAAERIAQSAVKMALRLADILLIPVILLSAVPFRLFRRVGAERLPLARQLFRNVGLWPLRRHYYEPLIDPRDLSRPLDAQRSLAGLDWNVDRQLAILRSMRFRSELQQFLAPAASSEPRFSYSNRNFLSGDADYLYSFVRRFRPKRIVEVGCGNSTLLILAANKKNRADHPEHVCEHICIEPYEQPWLESVGARVLRRRVEHTDLNVFTALEAGDLLFIDSSHVIRPCGDVVFQVLEVLPVLNSGVIVHFHDIFSPRNYLAEWVYERGYLWNEQYLIEAFLSFNSKYQIIGALNYIHHHHYADLEAICAQHAVHYEPGSLYIERR